jgi:gamma-glutamylcyclotransferase (GGCT)/AIG2-like uncharacterized protein YtfP
MLEYVFVYGTLRRNEANHAFMDGAELVADRAHVFGQMWDTGLGYPALVLAGRSKVYGELYRVSPAQLRRLDELEGYVGPGGPNEYERVEETVYAEGRCLRAYVYVYTQPPAAGVRLTSGDWTAERGRSPNGEAGE